MDGKPSDDQIERAIRILENGGVVIFPTDTVYGIGCCFDNRRVVDRIYQIKNTPKTQFFPVLVSGVDQLRKYAQVTKQAENLIKKHWPGGLTIILFPRYPELVSGSHQKVGFRMPDSAIVRSIIDGVGVPIIGTSANFHGSEPPKSYEELDPDFTKLSDFVLKGECKFGKESTVVDATCDVPKILRQGATTL